MMTMVKTSEGKVKVDPTPEQFDMTARVFRQAGGSWERLGLGSIDDMTLLKTVIKVAIKKGIYTKASKW